LGIRLIIHDAMKPSGPGKGKPQTGNCLSKWEKDGDSLKECYMFDEEEQYRLFELERRTANLDFEALTRGLSIAAANEKIDALMDKIWHDIPIPTDKPLSEYLHEQQLQALPEQPGGQKVIDFNP
jgi:hypothetical protein